ncbi:serpin family protein [Paenibacillus daejeonensis]|uniref:serpin family protein n=1 Tax=Paenibacillus daejeonensis TaxID=135193 RepID=UPI0003627BE2|nr:serpin family protein [Paenibacillus daejeonensis]
MNHPNKRLNMWITGGLCTCLLLSGCGTGSGNSKEYAVDKMDSSVEQATYQPSDLDPDFAEDQLAFAFELYQTMQTHKPSPPDNDTISPVSIATALSMTMNGAAGVTLTQMEEALHSAGRDAEARNQGYAVLADLLSHSGEHVKVSLANSLWGREPLQFKTNFIETNQTSYNAAIEALDFTQDDAADRINAWVREQTAGKIDKMIEPPISGDLILYLLNTVYFKGAWQSEFKAEATSPDTFTNASGQAEQVPMMNNHGYYPYVQQDGFQAIRLPYKQSGLGMVILMPDEEQSLEALIEQMNPGTWQGMLEAMEAQQGHIRLPKFKLEFNMTLKDTLQAMGISDAFHVERADFTPMIELEDNVFIGEATHKTFIEVDEKGTEAAAATVIGMEAGSAPPKDPFEMIVNRPFFFAIEDERTSAILFMGSVHNILE